MPIEQVQVLLGHSQIDTTLRYAMVNQNNVKASHHKYIGWFKSKFAEMFGNIEDRIKLALVAPLHTDRADIDMVSIDSYITTDNMLQNKRGIISYMGTLENIAGAVEYHCNDILVSNIRPYLKKIWLSDRDGGCSTDILVFRIKDISKFLPVYVYYTLYQDAFLILWWKGRKV